jgi:hypothetical protein
MRRPCVDRPELAGRVLSAPDAHAPRLATVKRRQCKLSCVVGCALGCHNNPGGSASANMTDMLCAKEASAVSLPKTTSCSRQRDALQVALFASARMHPLRQTQSRRNLVCCGQASTLPGLRPSCVGFLHCWGSLVTLQPVPSAVPGQESQDLGQDPPGQHKP